MLSMPLSLEMLFHLHSFNKHLNELSADRVQGTVISSRDTAGGEMRPKCLYSSYLNCG